MKQIFTLLIIAFTTVFGANAQINQNFESTTSLSQLTNACWQFGGIVFSTGSQLNGSNSLQVMPTTSNTISATVTTPYVNLVTGAAISFNYKLSSRLSTQADRVISVRLLPLSGTAITLQTVNLNRNSPTTIQTINTTSTVTGIYKIFIEIAGSGDGNTSVHFDDLDIAGTFNYNSPYGCNSGAGSALPVYLTNFNGLLQDEKASLQWQVAKNEGGNYFELEKSMDGRIYKAIAVVATSEKQGNETYNYSEVFQGSAYYRLKMVSKNKELSYSSVVFLRKQATNATALNIIQNPAKENLRFSFNALQAGVAEVSIYDFAGVKIYQNKISMQRGVNSVTTDLPNIIRKGMYLLEINTAGSSSSVKFLKD